MVYSKSLINICIVFFKRTNRINLQRHKYSLIFSDGTGDDLYNILFILEELVVSFQKESNHDRFGKEVQWRRFENWIIRCVTSKREEIL